MTLVRHIYGRSITFRYTPLAGDEEFVADSLVSARLYGPNTIPSDAQIEDDGLASTGHVGSRVTSWELVNNEGTGAAEFKIVFPPLVDTQRYSRTEYDLYYVALNYLAEAGGEELCDYEQIQVFRADGLTSKIRVTAEDLYKLESKLAQLAPSRLWTEDKIDLAIEDLLDRLDGRGYEKRRQFNLEKLNIAATRLACSLCCDDVHEDGTGWQTKADRWRERSDKAFEIAQVGYDLAGSDTPTPAEKVLGGYVIIGK